ncbi:MAG: PqqD family protein [Polyangiaceae bacterium]
MKAPIPAPNPAALFVASKRQVACTVGGEAVILHLDDGVYYSLNPVGAHVWSLLQQPRTTEELVRHVLAEFEVEEERCRAEVTALVDALRARALLVQAETTE